MTSVRNQVVARVRVPQDAETARSLMQAERVGIFLAGGFDIPACQAQETYLGIDGSVAKIGFSLLRGSRIRSWVFHPRASGGVKRLAEIRDVTADILSTYGVSAVCIEGYSFGSRATQAHSTGEAGGVIRLALYDAKVPFVDIPPTSLKKFLSGKGTTPKTGMPLALFKQYGVEYANEDETDAAGLVIMAAALGGAHHRDLLKYQQDALTEIRKKKK